jgi:hypothetical protein
MAWSTIIAIIHNACSKLVPTKTIKHASLPQYFTLQI